MKKSLKLYEIQKALMNSIMSTQTEKLAYIVCEKPPISTIQRIGIYQDAYRIRMLESLRDDFSRVEDKLGADEFERVALQFVSKHPSTYASLAEVSQHFPDFLKTISNELYELASQDWIEILADKARRFSPAKVATIQEIQAGVAFNLVRNPTLFIFKGKAAISIAYRDSSNVFLKTVTPSEFEVLDSLKKPMTVEELSIQLATTQSKWEDIQSLISSWVKNEMILCERISYV